MLAVSPFAPVLLGGSTGAQRALRYGLFSAWNMEEASGQRNDAYGTNHLADNNTVTTAAAKVGTNAAQFTLANTEYLSIADNPSLSIGDADFWCCAWFYLDTVSSQTILAKSNPSADAGYRLAISGTSVLRAELSPDGSSANTKTLDHATVLNAGQWYFAFFAYDAVNDLMYLSLDGGAFATLAESGGSFDTACEFRIGARLSGGVTNTPFNGRIDAVAIGASPPLGVAALASEMRNFLWNGGSGREWPWF